MELRPYQQDAVDRLWRALFHEQRALCVMATGGGKTECMIALAARAGVRTLVVMGRDRLIEQTARRMRAVLPDVGVWSAGQGERRIAPVTVVSIHSADALTVEDARLLIVDECHNMNEGRYAALLDRHPQAKLVGFTATPWRAAVPIYGDHEGALFPRVTYRRGLKELIADGHLVPPVARAMPLGFDVSEVSIVGGDYAAGELAELVRDDDKVRAQVADALMRLEGRQSVVWICTTIDHAENVAEELAVSGEHAAVMHSKVDTDGLLGEFELGLHRHIVSVMMLTEGIDIPRIDAIVLMRPTRSPTLLVQAVGRGLRLSPGKRDCLVLDYGDVFTACGPLHDPYLREPGKRREPIDPLKTMRICRGCLAYLEPSVTVCPDCGNEDKAEVDRLRALSRQAATVDPLGDSAPEVLECWGVSIGVHRSRKGNDCIVLLFDVRGRMWPVRMFGSEHAFSWGKFRAVLHQLTPFRFDSWRECYDAVGQLDGTLAHPARVTVERSNGFEGVIGIEVVRVEDRDADSGRAS